MAGIRDLLGLGRASKASAAKAERLEARRQRVDEVLPTVETVPLRAQAAKAAALTRRGGFRYALGDARPGQPPADDRVRQAFEQLLQRLNQGGAANAPGLGMFPANLKRGKRPQDPPAGGGDAGGNANG